MPRNAEFGQGDWLLILDVDCLDNLTRAKTESAKPCPGPTFQWLKLPRQPGTSPDRLPGVAVVPDPPPPTAGTSAQRCVSTGADCYDES